MNTTIIVVGKRGVITIPSKVREELDIQEGDALRVTQNLDGTLKIERVGK